MRRAARLLRRGTPASDGPDAFASCGPAPTHRLSVVQVRRLSSFVAHRTRFAMDDSPMYLAKNTTSPLRMISKSSRSSSFSSASAHRRTKQNGRQGANAQRAPTLRSVRRARPMTRHALCALRTSVRAGSAQPTYRWRRRRLWCRARSEARS